MQVNRGQNACMVNAASGFQIAVVGEQTDKAKLA